MSKESDRFITDRSNIDKQITKFNLDNISSTKKNYNQLLENIFGFSSSINLISSNRNKQSHYIYNKSYKILDAPNIIDDYYLNLLDWSSTNIIALALDNKVYTFNYTNGEINFLCENDHNYTSVSWSPNGSYIAIGNNNGEIHIIDILTRTCINMFKHIKRIPTLTWNNNILSSGCHDGIIKNWDKRMSQPCITTMHSHKKEICGLKWNPSGTQLASGGNDNMLCIWDVSYRQLHCINAHKAAVKALAWCPWEDNLLASGGGTADRCIKFWNSLSGKMLNYIDTNSQVCGLLWSPYEKEILSSHGFAYNQLSLWKYPKMTKIQDFLGHTSRVLHMAQNPNGPNVVTASTDETVQFWKPFGNSPKSIFTPLHI